ncbi:hypothetical protein NLG97_g5971 [Lecanicillium saksenae]|uniref:Uncharacterized protein n=1 Tax=Lecanicillium saksenae TaxID=468837 RepID=A0ACC1QU45_9HYPO|nr:hypothetical protein NLG97_g5971 [Lecanicillium saksenae]
MYGPVAKIINAREMADGVSEDLEEEEGAPEDSGWERGVTDNEFENVGWMYMVAENYVIMQDRLNDPTNWEDEYVRPPLTRFIEDFDKAPGFWRRSHTISYAADDA